MIIQRELSVDVACHTCGRVSKLSIDREGFESWTHGESLIQDAFPYLSADERELLISQICGDCWDRMFRDE